jgi:hypothetical protein
MSNNHLTHTQILAVRAGLDAGLSLRQISVIAGVSQGTAIRYRNHYRRGLCAGCFAELHDSPCVYKHARATPAMISEMRNLRQIEDLSTVAIAARFNVSSAVAYNVLAGYPRRARLKVNSWTETENATLARVWPMEQWSEILSLFPNRTRGAIERQAAYCKLRRSSRLRQHKTIMLHPMIQILVDARVDAGLSATSIVRNIPHTAANSIVGYESGNAEPTLGRFTAWAAALGYELVLRRQPATKTAPMRVLLITPQIALPAPRQVPPARVTPPAAVIPAAAPIAPPARPRAPPTQRPSAVMVMPPKRQPPPPERTTAARAAELTAQERFLAERGATRLPPTNDPVIMDLPPLVFDMRTRKWTRRADAMTAARRAQGRKA